MGKEHISIIIEGAGILRKELNKKRIILPCDVLVSDLAKKIKIKKGLQVAFFRDGKRVHMHTKLKDGDIIKIVPLVFGG